MCYYSGIKSETIQKITVVLGLTQSDYIYPQYEQISAVLSPVFPVLTMDAPRRLQPMHWLFTPPWFTTSEQLKNRKIWAADIRLEEAETKKLYAPVVETGRCAAVFSHFFEWRHDGSRKTKYKIELRDRAPMLLPGLYSVAEIDGETWFSFGVCTMEARHIMRHIHNKGLRQPVVIGTETLDDWLDSRVSFPKAREKLLEKELSEHFFPTPSEIDG